MQRILHAQDMFTAVVLRENETQTLPCGRYHNPFIGGLKKIGRGASGDVSRVEIAAGHWQFNYEGRKDLQKSLVLAVKNFHTDGHDSAQSAEKNYTAEKEFLQELKSRTTTNKMLHVDRGSIIQKNEQGHFIHMIMVFDLATCDLNQFFRSEEWAQKDFPKHVVLSKAVEILEALDFLHTTFKRLHLDIKPPNILVFERKNYGHHCCWKLADFNFSKHKIKKSIQFEHSGDYSCASIVLAQYLAGKFQAPQVQPFCRSQVGDGSDIWSMGGVLLMIFAFLYSCPENNGEGVQDFDDDLKVCSTQYDARSLQFYVTPDLCGWPPAEVKIPYLGEYVLPWRNIKQGSTSGTAKASVHPGVVPWSTVLRGNAERDNESETTILS